MFIESAVLVLRMLSMFYITIILLRFMLQLARADFYNPISQFVVKVTNPLLVPLRKVVPGIGGFDGASIVLAILVQTAVFLLIALMVGLPLAFVTFIAWSVVVILQLLVQIYFWALIAVIILSWIAPGAYHPAAQLLYQLTEPVLRPFRKLLPPVGGLDLSPILVFLVIAVLQEVVLPHLAMLVGLGHIGY